MEDSRRSIRGPAGHTWTLSPTLLMDMTFGFGRQKQEVLGPDFESGNFGLDVLGIPGTNDQGIGDARYAGYPSFETCTGCAGTAFQRRRQPRRLESHLSRRADVFADGEPDEGEGPPRLPHRIHDEFPVSGPLAAGNRKPARTVYTSGRTRPALRGGQTTNFYNQWASFMLGLVGDANKSLQNELMTAREWQHALYLPRSLDAERQADARPRVALGAVPHHASRRTGAASIASIRRRSGSGRRTSAATTRTTAWRPDSTTSRRGWARSTA